VLGSIPAPGGRRWWRRITLATVIAAFVIIPFVVVGERLEGWSVQSLRLAAGHPRFVAGMVVALLAADIVLPIPSSVVSTSGGLLLGFAGGFTASVLGMTLCAASGYALGRSAGPFARRLIGADDANAAHGVLERHGDWILVITRGVPVLAESTVILAGLGKVPLRRFLALTVLANAGISAAYAGAGAFAADTSSFLLACAGALMLPIGPMLWLRRQRYGRPAGA
jgi:uncharacterized membrane protein YdjX (TVP38/TMEM64 family)